MIAIGNIVITTEHPASHYGAGVAIIDDVAHGPDDIIDSGAMPFCPSGLKLCVADMICSTINASRRDYTRAEIRQINTFLSQSPEARLLDFTDLQRIWANNRRATAVAEQC